MVFRPAFCLPYILPSAVIALIWTWLYALQMAAAVLGGLPLAFVFPLAQRQIVEGVAGAGLK